MFRFRHSSVVSAFGVLAIALVASAGSLSVVEAPKLTFDASGEGLTVIGIKGSADKLTASDDGKDLVLTVDVNSVKTGNKTRDGHLKQRFHGHPVTLTVPKSALKMPSGKPTKGAVQGTLRANNKNESLTVNYTASGSDGVYDVKGNFTFDMLAHVGEEEICFAGVCAGNKVTVTASFKLKEK
jgi:polyisoprenoid-binding protein YceI